MNVCKVEDKKLKMDKDNCKNCGRCVNKCYFNAIEKGTYGYKIFTSEKEIFELIERTILFYKENDEPKERFAKTIERMGFEEVEKILLSCEK